MISLRREIFASFPLTVPQKFVSIMCIVEDLGHCSEMGAAGKFVLVGRIVGNS